MINGFKQSVQFMIISKNYETIANRCNIELDRGNFSRKLKSLGLLIDLKENEKFVSHRPGKLFKFNYEEYEKKRSKGFSFEI